MPRSDPASRWRIVSLALAFVFALTVDHPLPAQQVVVPGTNVNMVSGTEDPFGDPFLQRQNEPSSAVSTYPRIPDDVSGNGGDRSKVSVRDRLYPVI